MALACDLRSPLGIAVKHHQICMAGLVLPAQEALIAAAPGAHAALKTKFCRELMLTFVQQPESSSLQHQVEFCTCIYPLNSF